MDKKVIQAERFSRRLCILVNKPLQALTLRAVSTDVQDLM